MKQTNQTRGIRFDEGFAGIDEYIGTTGANPLLSLVPGYRAGTVKLHIADGADSPDVLTVAAFFDNRTMKKVIVGRIEQSIVNGFVTEEQVREAISKKGWKLYLNRNYEEGKSGEMRYHITVSAKGKAGSYMKSLETLLATKFEQIGKTQDIEIRHKTEKDDEDPTWKSVSIRDDQPEKGVMKMLEKFDPTVIRTIQQLLTDVEETLLIAEELATEPETTEA